MSKRSCVTASSCCKPLMITAPLISIVHFLRGRLKEKEDCRDQMIFLAVHIIHIMSFMMMMVWRSHAFLIDAGIWGLWNSSFLKYKIMFDMNLRHFTAVQTQNTIKIKQWLFTIQYIYKYISMVSSHNNPRLFFHCKIFLFIQISLKTLEQIAYIF